MVKIPQVEMDTLFGIRRSGTVIELGNKKNATGCYRELYKSRGYEYVCLDWNGKDGAVNIDMGKPLMVEWPDIAAVTNFGFSEHVYTDQEACWRNILELCLVGTYYCFVLPQPGKWEHHGVYQPSLSWVEQWLKENGFKISYIKNDPGPKPTFSGQARRQEYTPWFWTWAGMHITDPAKRRNPEEKACGIG